MILPFAVRSRLRWRGLRYGQAAEAPYEPPTRRGRELVARYALEPMQGRWSRETWRQTLGTLDLLDWTEFSPAPGMASVLDVGANHWRYAGALAAWLAARGARRASVTGVELDAFRLYANLRTPAAVGEHHARLAGEFVHEARYVPGDVRALPPGGVDLVTWFFPFVFGDTARAWGLPARAFVPEALFASVLGRLNPGGICLIVSPGEEEYGELRRHLVAGVPRARQVWEARVEHSLHAAEHPLFVSLWLARSLNRTLGRPLELFHP